MPTAQAKQLLFIRTSLQYKQNASFS